MWERWNQATKIFEKSTDNGGSWTPLGLDASIITQGMIDPARLPPASGGNVTGPASVPNVDRIASYADTTGKVLKDAGFSAANVPLKSTDNTFAARQIITGGATGAYNTAPIEIQMGANPRVSFHWPGVVASQLGMDSAGVIRTFDNPGTGYADFACGQLLGVPLIPYGVVWQSTGTQPVLGNGSIVGYYARLGTTICFKVQIIMGSTTTYGTGNYRVTLPIAWNAGLPYQLCDFIGYDSSAGTWWRGVGLMDVAGAASLRHGATSVNVVSPTTPQTWASGDQFHLNGCYFI
jgi:hypothetical protein